MKLETLVCFTHTIQSSLIDARIDPQGFSSTMEKIEDIISHYKNIVKKQLNVYEQFSKTKDIRFLNYSKIVRQWYLKKIMLDHILLNKDICVMTVSIKKKLITSKQ